MPAHPQPYIGLTRFDSNCLTPYHHIKQANHFNTYGGNPLASAVGIAVLDAIEKDECQKRSEDIGTYLLGELAKFREQFEVTLCFRNYLVFTPWIKRMFFQSASEMFAEKDL